MEKQKTFKEKLIESGTPYLKIFWSISGTLGFRPATMFGILDDRDAWDEYIPLSIDLVSKEYGMSGYYQRMALKQLEEAEIVSVIYKDKPAKRYVKINTEKFLEYDANYNEGEKYIW